MPNTKNDQIKQAALDIMTALDSAITEPLAIVRKSCRTYADAEHLLDFVMQEIAWHGGNDFRMPIIKAMRTALEQEKSRQPMIGGSQHQTRSTETTKLDL